MNPARRPVTRVHRMPFGVQVLGERSRFRLWAPAARGVSVELDAPGDVRALTMDATGDGWFECVAEAGAGTRYMYRIDDRKTVPDPASRANPDGVHGASVVIDPARYGWHDDAWCGRPWEEAVVYELHVGTFTRGGTFADAAGRLDDLVDLGVTAVELMPVAAFPGTRGWGYDGVLPFAPAACYGVPDDLKRLVDAAHARGLMVLLDVVYNHFGPEGNYLHLYAPQFFNPRHQTPWGAAINFDAEHSETVRSFFIHNALYWLEEFHFDGLRLDAVHAIADHSRPDFVTELATRVREQLADRSIHLVLENDRNEAGYLVRDTAGRPPLATAQWNDDVHHALHVLATGENDGYYAEYARDPLGRFGRALAEGFAWQGELSPYRGAVRGERSTHLPSPAFVSFAQNHDQVGNRAFGDRIGRLADTGRLRGLMACILLAPQVPLLFMGEEFGASTPFLFFCDFGAELADAVTRGRREEFAKFARFSARSTREAIPDPIAITTFTASKLDWDEIRRPPGAQWRAFYRRCLALRRQHIVPFLDGLRGGGTFSVEHDALLRVEWSGSRGRLHLIANFGDAVLSDVAIPAGDVVFATDGMPLPGREADVPRDALAFVREAAV
ncbi:MAG TPA: malto-oligosyltrehalose trehalohydrolase [Casimicrobiaceae bacterium]|nr:malto-oligosyltrehalose trehalohydrolase [Casimicrobiaceae bacterium]